MLQYEVNCISPYFSEPLFYVCTKPYEVYEIIDRFLEGQDPLSAIEASSWCELACDDEVYEDRDDRFYIEVKEKWWI